MATWDENPSDWLNKALGDAEQLSPLTLLSHQSAPSSLILERVFHRRGFCGIWGGLGKRMEKRKGENWREKSSRWKMNKIYENNPPLACCTVLLLEIYFPAPHTDWFQMRQISRLPSLSLRNCQQINRSSQYSNCPQSELLFSITSLNLYFPWSSLSLCLCPLNACFISTTIIFPFSSVISWPGYIELSLWSKAFQPIIIFMPLFTVPLCIVVFLCFGVLLCAGIMVMELCLNPGCLEQCWVLGGLQLFLASTLALWCVIKPLRSLKFLTGDKSNFYFFPQFLATEFLFILC